MTTETEIRPRSPWFCSRCGEPVLLADARAHYDRCDPETDAVPDDEREATP